MAIFDYRTKKVKEGNFRLALLQLLSAAAIRFSVQ
jgi:hypothetical protein